MKTAILLAFLALAALCVSSAPETNGIPGIKIRTINVGTANITNTNDWPKIHLGQFVAYLKENGQMSNLVTVLLATGDVCAVKGHNWRPGRPGEGEGSPHGGWFLDNHPNVSYRTCRNCFQAQSQSLEWKP